MGKTKRRRSIKSRGTKFACIEYNITKDNKKNLNEKDFYDTYENNVGNGNKLYQGKSKHCCVNLGGGMWGSIHNRSYQGRLARHLEKKSLRRVLNNEARDIINSELESD